MSISISIRREIIGFAEFQEITCGSLFTFKGETFIKTRDVEYLEYLDGEQGHYNAVSIKTGKFYNIKGREMTGLIEEIVVES